MLRTKYAWLCCPLSLMVIAMLIGTAAPVSAGTIYTINSTIHDGQVQRYAVDGTFDWADQPPTNPTYPGVVFAGGAGSVGTTARVASPILFFELPSMPGIVRDEYVNAASFSIYYQEKRTAAFDVDLYGLGYIATADIIDGSTAQSELEKYHYAGLGDTRDGFGDGFGPVQPLQRSFVTNATEVGTLVSTDAAGGANLTTFLNDLYDAGAEPGDWAVLRLSPTSGSFAIARYHFATGRHQSDPLPLLSMTIVPEPSSAALLGIGALLILLRRRRRRVA